MHSCFRSRNRHCLRLSIKFFLPANDRHEHIFVSLHFTFWKHSHQKQIFFPLSAIWRFLDSFLLILVKNVNSVLVGRKLNKSRYYIYHILLKMSNIFFANLSLETERVLIFHQGENYIHLFEDNQKLYKCQWYVWMSGID